MVFIRAVTYATLFIGFLLVFLPARVLQWSGVTLFPMIGVWQVRKTLLVWAFMTILVEFWSRDRDAPTPL